MKKHITLTILPLLFLSMAYGHDARSEHHHLREWHITNPHKHVHASFLFLRNDTVFLENEKGLANGYLIQDLSESDQSYIQKRQSQVERLNAGKPVFYHKPHRHTSLNKLLAALCLLLAMAAIGFLYWKKKVRWALVIVLCSTAFGYAFRSHFAGPIFNTDPLFIDAAFEPFKPDIATHWDNNWFYVESTGIPGTHPMMAGIVKWQQQVPVPQCYIGDNAWQIPLNPVLAPTPVPVNPQHFIRGAVAIAANGVPIFNPYTNTGVDALLDGQLDQWGGHSGRADDYHYHTAPLHLEDQTEEVLPIAFALDGFAVYGSVEPDGSPMLPLDANHGHYDQAGVYHYHGTANAPYMIGNMVGQVTEDATMQIVPQAHAMPVRPSLTPLNGAAITSCVPNLEGNGYTLSYTRNGQNFQVEYSWSSNGIYTYNFIAPTGTTTEVYNGFLPCDVPTGVDDLLMKNVEIVAFPNPATGHLILRINGSVDRPLHPIGCHMYNAEGQLALQQKGTITELNVDHLPRGVYWLKVLFEEGDIFHKIILQ